VLHGEMLHQVQPSIRTMFADLLRVRVVTYTDGKIHRVTGRSTRPSFSGTRATIAGMAFDFSPVIPRGENSGTMISFTDSDGETGKPGIVADKPRSGKRPYRTAAAIQRYLDTPAAISGPCDATGLRRPIRAIVVHDHKHTASEGVEEARAILRKLEIDGSVAFRDLPFPAKRCPTVTAKGVRFIAGVSAGKQTASAAAPLWQLPDVEPLSPVLEELAARGTLESIGIKMGYRGGYADRGGKKLLLAAGRELVAANNNNNLKKIAA
jgi:hypothetical protein